MGSVAGFGGGVIIKPVLDAIGILPVSSISFLSGITVLSTSLVSLLKNKNGIVSIKTTVPLAAGAALGGIMGRTAFSWLLEATGKEAFLGALQSGILLLISLSTALYLRKKHQLHTWRIFGIVPCTAIGSVLGIVSSFLGIGGGPYNMAILYLLFSMEGTEAAKNSIFVILFSQIASLISAGLSGTIPQFPPAVLFLMVLGGIGGAMAGGHLSKKCTAAHIDNLLQLVLLLILLINSSNFIRFVISL